MVHSNEIIKPQPILDDGLVNTENSFVCMIRINECTLLSHEIKIDMSVREFVSNENLSPSRLMDDH